MLQDQTCKQHTGVVARIKHVEKETSDQWDKMSKQDDRMDSIFTRINFILGGIVIMTLSIVAHTLILIAKG